MKRKKFTIIICALCILLVIMLGIILRACGKSASVDQPKPEPAQTLSGDPLEVIEGVSGKFDFSYKNEKEMLGDMTLGCKNDNYSLYYNAKSMATALINNKTGKIFLSNPYNAAEDPYYFGDVAKKLASQVIVDYVDSDNAVYSIYSSSDCAELGQYSISHYVDGIRFDLSIGKEMGKLLNPELFTVSDYETWLSKMSGRDAGRFESYYMYVDFKQVTDAVRKDNLKKQYPMIEKTPMYVLSELNDKEKIRLDEILKNVGYTIEKYEADMKKYGFSDSQKSYPNFKLSLVYRLTDDGICVTVPRDSISYNKDFRLSAITFLPYFAADCETSGDGGYLFIPDGSGSLININNQDPQRRRMITKNVYGYDSALDQTKNLNEGGMQYYLPTFGIRRNNGTAVAAIIENGDEMSNITASLGDPNGNYYTVYNTFTYRANELVIRDTKVSSMGSAKPIYLFDDNLSHSDYSVSYHILSDEKATYSGMAEVYRNYLIQKGMQENSNAFVHLGIETMGSALYNTSFLGFAYDTDAVFTTYNQNIKILQYLKKNGLSNLSLSMMGWQEDGMDGAISNKIRFSNALGGKNAFAKLQKYCNSNDIPLYPVADFAYVRKDVWGDGYDRRNDAARQMSRQYAKKADKNSPEISDKPIYILSPIRYGNFFKSLSKSCDENKISSLCLDSFGSDLISDFDEDHCSNRIQTRIRLERMLKGKKNIRFSFVGANAYILPYAAAVSDIPLTDSGYPGESTPVPFLQLVLSGCVDYESPAINLMNVPETQLLYCIASGTSPKFMLAYDNIEKLKLTDYTEYYAISFEVLKKDIVKYGKYVQEALSVTDGTRLKAHERIADGVTVSTFENGAVIYVNTSDKDYVADGATVKAKNYYAVKGEGLK